MRHVITVSVAIGAYRTACESLV